MTGKIDDPIDASFQAFPDEPEGWGNKFKEVALSLTGHVFLPAVLFKILSDQLSQTSRFKRITYLLRAFTLKIGELERQAGDDRGRIKALQAYVESPRFQEAAATACEEAARASDVNRVERMAKVLSGSLTPTQWSPKDENVATLIRDLAQLGDRDVQVLQKLSIAFGALMLAHPSFPDDLFPPNNSSFEKVLREDGDRDGFYSTCARLIGFGLAIDVTWPMNWTQPHERCIRPTRRGLALLGYLELFQR